MKASRLYFANILPILTFPSLRTLEITVESPSNWEYEPVDLDLGPRLNTDLVYRLREDKSPLQRLSLSGTYRAIASLCFIAESCNSLKALAVDF